MSYIDLNWDFSQFDLDNHWRTTAASYLTSANAIAQLVLDSDDPDAGMAALQDADVEAGLTKEAFAAHDYDAAFDHAKAAFGFAKTAAHDAGVPIPASSQGWFVLPPSSARIPTGDTPSYANVDSSGERTHRMRP